MPKPESKASLVALPQDLDMLSSETLKMRLLELLDGDEPLAIDGSAVLRASSAPIQVIYAAGQSAKEQGRKLELHAPSDALAEAFRDLGLESEFQEWSSADA